VIGLPLFIIPVGIVAPFQLPLLLLLLLLPLLLMTKG
jgi:hypothetical protein